MTENTSPNIILINIDGFRRDKINLCPKLNEIKDNSDFFSNMFTVAPYTFASLHSVFSGLYPSSHGVNAYYNIYNFKKKKITTLAELLKTSNYYTCCDVISEAVMPKQGIDDWNVFDEETVNFKTRHKDLIKKISKNEKFFLFLHYTEIHKYLVREIVKKYKQESNDDDFFKSQKENNERYNSYLPTLDEYLSTITNTVEELGISDNTVLILFSDHGASIGEKNGEKFYGVFTYDYTIKVFCMFYQFNNKSKIIDKQCRTIDIFPSVLELAGIVNNSEQIQGKSLLSFLNNSDESERTVFVETGGLYGPWPSPEKHTIFCIRKNDKKLIYNDTPETWEFYNLIDDPDELNNIYDENSHEISELKKILLLHMAEQQINTKISP